MKTLTLKKLLKQCKDLGINVSEYTFAYEQQWINKDLLKHTLSKILKYEQLPNN